MHFKAAPKVFFNGQKCILTSRLFSASSLSTDRSSLSDLLSALSSRSSKTPFLNQLTTTPAVGLAVNRQAKLIGSP